MAWFVQGDLPLNLIICYVLNKIVSGFSEYKTFGKSVEDIFNYTLLIWAKHPDVNG